MCLFVCFAVVCLFVCLFVCLVADSIPKRDCSYLFDFDLILNIAAVNQKTKPIIRDSKDKVLPLDDGVYDEEILVFPLPDVSTDKLKTESEVFWRIFHV